MLISEYAESCVYTEGGDYKDCAADLSYHLEQVCPKELVKDMPDGYSCPRAFYAWYEGQE